MRLLLIILSIVFLNSCSQIKTAPGLETAESIIETNPDSALHIIEGIDVSSLRSRHEIARYSLLTSMALDKNYIDTTTFEILNPAIEYFLEKGTPDDKIRTLYYQGRIFQNRGERDSAMNSFYKAIEFAPEIKDSLVLARALVAQGILFNELYDSQDYIANNLRAAKIYKNLADKDHEFDCLLNALNGFIVTGDKNRADSIIAICNNIRDLDVQQERYLHRYQLSYELKFGTKETIQEIIDRFGGTLAVDINSVMDIAFAYDKMGNPEQAKTILEDLKGYNISFDTLKYEAIFFTVLEDLGNYEKALEMYKTFSHRLALINADKFAQKSQSLEDKHQYELKVQAAEREKSKILWWSIAGIICLSSGLYILLLLNKSHKAQKDLVSQKAKIIESENARLKSEKEKSEIEKRKLYLENSNLQLERDKKALEAENLAHRIEILEEESESLKEIMNNHKGLPNEVQDAIKIRIEMLNALLAGYITENEKYTDPYEIWVKELTDNTESFMNTTRLAFQASHPDFIKYMEDHGLTLSEINYVCLYAIGLRGKEVGNYIKKRSHVNISSGIRKKLGIDKHETNIGIYVRKLLKEL